VRNDIFSGINFKKVNTQGLQDRPTSKSHFISDAAISFRTLWTIFWLAKTSNKPISLTTWLAVDPNLVILLREKV